MSRDYYAILGVTVSARPAEIRRAYQRLARQYSPDVNLWEQDARALFGEIAEAYRVLADPVARALYDRRPPPPAGEVRESPPPSGRRGDDLVVPVELAFGQSVSGLQADIPVERLSACRECGATGTARGAAPGVCGHCGGAGLVWQGRTALERGPCPACDGKGVAVTEPCGACRGRGVKPERGLVHAVLPPGLDTGAQFRIPDEGHAGPFGGPRGDLVIVARVHEDPAFIRKGDNLYRDVPLTIVEAMLGVRIPVEGIDGEVILVVPPGTQAGQVFRLRGKGMPKLSGGGRGDLYVTARVDIPRDLDARTQELVRELGRLLPGAARRHTPDRGAR